MVQAVANEAAENPDCLTANSRKGSASFKLFDKSIEAKLDRVLCGIQAVDFHVAGGLAQGAQYVLETAAARSRVPHGLPYLPSGNLVAGLPAAILSLCQVRRTPVCRCQCMQR